MTDVADPAVRGNARGRRTRRRLLDAAAECFGERGYSATRIADITAAAGMSQGGFYRHFKDKNDILVEALHGPLEELLEATRFSGVGDVDEQRIITAHTRFFTVYAKHRKVLRVIREAAALHEPGLVDLWLGVRGRYIARLETWLRELQDGGLLTTSDVTLLAEALGAVLDQVAYTRIGVGTTDPPPGEVEALGRVTAELWYRTLRG